jgi:hypothetical protein
LFSLDFEEEKQPKGTTVEEVQEEEEEEYSRKGKKQERRLELEGICPIQWHIHYFPIQITFPSPIHTFPLRIHWTEAKTSILQVQFIFSLCTGMYYPYMEYFPFFPVVFPALKAIIHPFGPFILANFVQKHLALPGQPQLHPYP